MMRVAMNLSRRIRPVAVVLALAIAAPAAAQSVRAGKTSSGIAYDVRGLALMKGSAQPADIC